MVVYLFGVILLLSCVNYVLRKIVYDYKGFYNIEVINIVFKNFYVDDCLKLVKIVIEVFFLLCDL